MSDETPKVRLLHFVIQPVLVYDDGESLTPGPPANQFTLSLADLDAFPEKVRGDLARIAEQGEEAQPDA